MVGDLSVFNKVDEIGSVLWYKFKTSRKKCNLIVRENFIGEIFKIFLVLCSCVVG